MKQLYDINDAAFDLPTAYRIGVNGSAWWELAIQPALADNSDGGILITQSEYTSITSLPTPQGATSTMVEQLVQRINSTLYSWDRGVLEGEDIISHSKYTEITERIVANTVEAREAGYGSILEWYGAGYEVFEQAEEDPDQGVCAKVRIQLQQRLAITREAFRATLVLENGESHTLTNIRVVIHIDDAITKTSSNHLFSIGESSRQMMALVYHKNK